MSDAAPTGSPYRGKADKPELPARPYIGGQAVLEGVMMRAPTSFAIVVRRRDGSLHVRERAMTVEEERKGIAKLPLVRGIASLVESLRLGSESLKFSAEQMERDEEIREAEEKAAASKAAKAASKVTSLLSAIGFTTFLLMSADGDAPLVDTAKPAEKKNNTPMVVMAVMMVAFMIALPQGAAATVNRLLHLNLPVQSPGFQALTGAFKLTIVVGYMLMIRTVFTQIRRVFQYHGAEHKTITTYEHNEPLTVENARKHTTLHPRCGTTFLVMVALVSILVFTAIGGFLPKIDMGNEVANNAVFFLEKLPFLPLIAGVTFEIQRVFAKYCQTGPLRALLWPGFLCQKITTIEPDDEQLEVALASLRVTLFREEGERSGSSADVRYANFDALMGAPQLRKAAA